MWEVKNNDTTVYLVGSVHVADENFYPIHAKYEKAFLEADYIGFEINLTEIPSAKEQKNIIEMSTYTDGSTIKEHVSKETYSRIVDFLMNNDIELESISMLKPFKLAAFIQGMAIENAEYIEGIDVYFLQKTLERGIPVIGVETLEAHSEVFAKISTETQERILNYTLDQYYSNTINDSTDELIDLWKKGDDESLLKIFNDMSSEQEYQKVMLTDRNILMANKVEELLNSNKEEVYFIMIGALHYPGKQGIIKLLQEKGYSVVRK